MTLESLAIGSGAPDFDLSSTEDVLLMLRDEVPRNTVVLYVFLEVDDSSRADLDALADRAPKLATKGVRVMALSPAKLPALKQLQADLRLPFPLLSDDRDFCAQYGVEAEVASRRLVAVNRSCKVAWQASEWSNIDQALKDMKSAGVNSESVLTNYPGKVINRLVSWWVN